MVLTRAYKQRIKTENSIESKSHKETAGITAAKATKAGVFVLIFAAIFAGLCYLFQPVWYDWSNYDTTHGFYEEPENSLETVFVGTSIILNSVTPMELYEDYGICSYNLGTERQPMAVSYYWLEETYRLHKESLKTVVLEVRGLMRENNDTFAHKGLDAMHFSSVKWKAFKDYSDGNISDTLTNLIPLFSYHDRWEELGKSDFTKSRYEVRNYLRGYNFETTQSYFKSNSYSEMTVPEYYPEFDDDKADDEAVDNKADDAAANDEVDDGTVDDETVAGEESELSDTAVSYLDKIVSFCDEHGLKLILIKSPGQILTDGEYNAVKNLADGYGLKYIDFNYEPYVDETKYVEALDRKDSTHLNYYGAKKLTSWLGKYLVEECDATDVRGLEGYEYLEDELDNYNQMITECEEINDITDPVEYLSRFKKDDNYATFVAVKGDGAKALTDEQRNAFKEIGLEKLSEIEYGNSYLAVIDSGSVKEDISDEKAVNSSGKLDHTTPYSVKSSGEDFTNTCYIKIDGEDYSCATRGLNIVVYDKENDSVVDSAVFNTSASPLRESGDLEASLANALEASGGDFTELSGDLKKLYLYNLRCEDAKILTFARQTSKDKGVISALEQIFENENYAIFISAKGDASGVFGSDDNKELKELGLTELSEIKAGDSYIATVLGGEVSEEKKDSSGKTISLSDAYFPDIKGANSILFKISSNGSSSASKSSIKIENSEYSLDKTGVNIVIWNVITNTKAAALNFGPASSDDSQTWEIDLGKLNN